MWWGGEINRASPRAATLSMQRSRRSAKLPGLAGMMPSLGADGRIAGSKCSTRRFDTARLAEKYMPGSRLTPCQSKPPNPETSLGSAQAHYYFVWQRRPAFSASIVSYIPFIRVTERSKDITCTISQKSLSLTVNLFTQKTCTLLLGYACTTLIKLKSSLNIKDYRL